MLKKLTLLSIFQFTKNIRGSIIKMQKSQEITQNKQQKKQKSLFNQLSLQQHQQLTYYPQAIEQFVTYTKTKEKKPRAEKRKQKLQKLRADFKNPQLRKERNRQRHQKNKQKLQKQLQGKTEEQIKQYLRKRKQEKNELKEKIKNSLNQENGISFLVDMCYENKMNQKQNKSLASQIQLIMKACKKFQNPPNIHLCGVGGKAEQQLQKMKYQFWSLKSNHEDLVQSMKKEQFQNKKFCYLSPDAPQSVQQVDKNCAFIIGGLVDRTVIKNASLNRANELNIQVRNLPIRQFMKQRTCLNLDHIVAIVCKYQQVKNWKQAFDYGAPTRWKKDYQKKVQNNQSKKQQDEQSENQQNKKLQEKKNQ